MSIDVIDTLTKLVDKSLVVFDEAPGRYSLLETVRQYSSERLLENGESEAVRRQHIDYFLGLAEEADSMFSGMEQVESLDQVEVEHDNIRAALQFSIESGTQVDVPGGAANLPQTSDLGVLGMRLAGVMWRFWMVRGYLAEGRSWLTSVLEQADGAERSIYRARALLGAGVLANQQADYPNARAFQEESLQMARKANDRRTQAEVLSELVNTLNNQGEYRSAQAALEKSLTLWRELDDKPGIAAALLAIGWVAFWQEDMGRAETLCEESLEIEREIGDRRGVARALELLGRIAVARGRDDDQATVWLEESLAIRRTIGDRHGIADSLLTLAWAAHKRGDDSLARSLYEDALSILEELGAWSRMEFALDQLRSLASLPSVTSSRA